MVKHAAQFVPLKIDVSVTQDLAAKYRVRALPTFLFIDAEGEVQETAIGYREPADFVRLLDGVTLRQVSQARRAAKKENADGEAHATLGLALAIRGEHADAEDALLKARIAQFRGPIVGRAYNNLGDRYLAEKKGEQAVDAFKRADRVGKDPIVRAYAKARLLDHYVAAGETRQAQRTAEALSRLDGAPPEYVKKAGEVLKD